MFNHSTSKMYYIVKTKYPQLTDQHLSINSNLLRKKLGHHFVMYTFVAESTTVSAQRNVELKLMNFLKKNKAVFGVWQYHPDFFVPDLGGVREWAETICDTKPMDEETSLQSELLRSAHVGFVKRQLQNLPSGLQGLYSSRPWLVYWCLQAADLLGITEELYKQVSTDHIADFLYSCLKEKKQVDMARDHSCRAVVDKKTKRGNDISYCSKEKATRDDDTLVVGFAGGPSCQIQHLITSYAACCALCILGKREYLINLPRAAIKRWLITLRNEDGSFCVHEGGESDIRASYCAAVITTLLRLDDPRTWEDLYSTGTFPHSNQIKPSEIELKIMRDSCVLTPQTSLFIAACQTHEGGLACAGQAAEAHSAYTHCGLAALLLMKQPHLIQHASLRRWLAFRQLSFDGGFNGRTNKLVDSCYAHWVGSSHALLSIADSYARLLNIYQPGLTVYNNPSHSNPTINIKYEIEDEPPHQPPPCLRAKEILLLDYAQLIDVSEIGCITDPVWSSVEEEYRKLQTELEQFIDADDDALHDGLSTQLWKKRVLCNFRSNSQPESQLMIESIDTGLDSEQGDLLFNQFKLQEYILQCCQDKILGGLMDKPDCAPDAYHTCYALSGLSLSQNLQYITHAQSVSRYVIQALQKGYIPGQKAYVEHRSSQVLSHNFQQKRYGVVVDTGSSSDAVCVTLLRSSNPIFNIHQSRVVSALSAWGIKKFL